MTSPDPFWIDRPTFVTGATGLVGAWTVRRLLARGAEVVCLVRDHVPQSEFHRQGLDQQVRIVRGDIADQALLERALGEYEIDTILHLAAQTLVPVANRNPVSTFQANIAGTWSLLEAARRSPCVHAIVLASSDKAYGEQPVQPYDESMPLQGRHPYDVSKSCADLIAQAYAATYDLPVAITRCGNFYGGGDLNWNRIVPGTIRSYLRHRRPVVRSTGQLVRDYFYVEDGAEAYLMLAKKLRENPELRGRAFNFSNHDPRTALDMVNLIKQVLGSDLEPEILGQDSGEIRYQALNSDLARRELGWMPLYDLQAGMKLTLDWYRQFFADNPNTEDDHDRPQ
ncbi:MAG: GDP-mannose 4,6-dehydratase [Phycisphaeraceae bacterium]|nr:GDP-mannose 4,6-dehydratase [Phycisphaeraceae bacterium]